MKPYQNLRILVIGCMAYANGLPVALTGKTLSIWLKSQGLSYTAIGFFGLMHLPWTLKFVWAPLLDQVPLPFLKDLLGQRRSWLCVCQVVGIASLLTLTFLDPAMEKGAFLGVGIILNLAAASQHILLLAYQMETLGSQEWGLGEGMSVFTFRLALLTAGAGALYLATCLPWVDVYRIMAVLMLLGLIAVFIMDEPRFPFQESSDISWVTRAILEPFRHFISQSGWMLILIFMVIYRLPNHLMSLMEPIFLVEVGFSYIEIGSVAKIFGLMATILGSLLGGVCIRFYGYQKTLLGGGIATGLGILLYNLQGIIGHSLPLLYLTIGVNHFCSALGLVAFFSYQLTCCEVRYAATQLALLTSFVELGKTLLAPLGGMLVSYCGWQNFFVIVAFSSLPGIVWVRRLFIRSQ